MDLKQILILALCLAPLWTCESHGERCYDEDRLVRVAHRKLKNRYPLPQEVSVPEASGGPVTCPLELYRTLPAPADQHARSLSPWRYVTVNMEHHFPSTFIMAQCLCSGCILFQDNGVVESHDYNSVTVNQTRTFLKRVPCDSGRGYKLKPVPVSVPVGCTCVRPRT